VDAITLEIALKIYLFVLTDRNIYVTRIKGLKPRVEGVVAKFPLNDPIEVRARWRTLHLGRWEASTCVLGIPRLRKFATLVEQQAAQAQRIAAPAPDASPELG
jgi:hypothetical protein